MRGIVTAMVFGLGCGAANADVPRVATDISPVHSIVAAVMGELGTPDLVVPPGASPHFHQMRPSEARALESAELFVWVGPSLTPWLTGPSETLGANADKLVLEDVEGTLLLDLREGATFDAHDHDHGHEDEDDEEDHDAPSAHDHHGDFDPHVWLDPENAKVWAKIIAAELGEMDPEHQAIYAANAELFIAELDALQVEVNAVMAPVRGRPFVVFHDAYHYFENRFGMEAVGAISASDATKPSAARLAELHDSIAAMGAVCALTEPQNNPALVKALGDVRLGELDPLGAKLTPGPSLYSDVLRNMAQALAACLS